MQDLFDEVMLKILETVSSEDYLSAYGIYRSPVLNSAAWDKFKSKINRQKKLGIRETPIVPGIYPRAFGADSVHYYSVRVVNGSLVVGNGYPTSAGINKPYRAPLNAQPDRSHGLCQTFALMFYLGHEALLIPGDYRRNIDIGLGWLKDFSIVQNWLWEHDRINVVMRKSVVYLSDLLDYVTDPANKALLDAWFRG